MSKCPILILFLEKFRSIGAINHLDFSLRPSYLARNPDLDHTTSQLDPRCLVHSSLHSLSKFSIVVLICKEINESPSFLFENFSSLSILCLPAVYYMYYTALRSLL